MATTDSLANLMMTKLNILGATGISLADKEKNYYSALSGLPVASSLADHKKAYYAAQAAVSSAQSINDVQFKYWIFVNAGNNVGSVSQRARLFYGP